jgi:TetR/AcrR family transcriptional regulator
MAPTASATSLRAASGTTARLRRRRHGNRRDPSLSKELILSAARDEFAQYGLNGARMDRIADRVGASKNLIYHYFGSKNRLYLIVLEAIYRDMRHEQDDAVLQAMRPIEGMRELVAKTFRHFVRTPALTRLMSIENIHYGEYLAKSIAVRPLFKPLLATIQSLLSRGQREGVFRRNVDPVDLYISISGLAYFYLSNRHTLSWIFEQQFDKPKRLQQRENHIVDVILGYLRFGTETAGAPSHARLKSKAGPRKLSKPKRRSHR